MKMVIVSTFNTDHTSEFVEHRIIRKQLIKFLYYNSKCENWRAITLYEGVDLECNESRILIRCKYARQTIYLPYPLKLEPDLLYLWGLIAGTSYHKKGLEIRVDLNQLPIIEKFAEKYQINLKIEHITRKRRRIGAKPNLDNYRQVKIKFPLVFRKVLYALGFRDAKNRIPKWLRYDQQLVWLEGYLNSRKIQCRFRKGNRFYPEIRIHVPQKNAPLLENVQSLLESLSIHYRIYKYDVQAEFRIVIQGFANLLNITEHFTIRRPNIRALLALVRKCVSDPSFQLNINKCKLTKFQLTLYGLILDQDLRELEYTLFEKTFACSSNDIRHNLYILDTLGLIKYYKDATNKEFFTQSNRYRTQLLQILKSEEEELRRLLKYNEENTISFHCPDCQTLSSYTEAMGDSTFGCPHCGFTGLEPLELSRYFYYGHIGVLAKHLNALNRGMA